jgi:hypothetical protein
MFTRKLSAIAGAILVLLTMFGASTTAHAAETSDSAAVTTPDNFCSIFSICP